MRGLLFSHILAGDANTAHMAGHCSSKAEPHELTAMAAVHTIGANDTHTTVRENRTVLKSRPTTAPLLPTRQANHSAATVDETRSRWQARLRRPNDAMTGLVVVRELRVAADDLDNDGGLHELVERHRRGQRELQ